MSTTLVGVFDNPHQANKACRALGVAGIDRSAIRMSSDELANDKDAATYVEAVQRGHVVVTVHLVAGDSADGISDLLEDCGAIDVDEHAARWKADSHLTSANGLLQSGDLQNGQSPIDGAAGARGDVRRGELTLHDLATARQHRGPFGIGYGGVERRYRAETYSGADRRAHA